jgi:hypothetical protein
VHRKKLMLLVLFIIIISFTGCDFIIYYSFLPSDSQSLSYSPVSTDTPGHKQDSQFPDSGIFPENKETDSRWYFGKESDSRDKEGVQSDTSAGSEQFSLVILPDTQYYSAYYPHIFKAQTTWISENKETLNIVFVLHEGDIVENNTVKEWETARSCMQMLDGIVPYVVTTGNHDIGSHGLVCNERDSTFFNMYFPVVDYTHLPTFGGVFEPEKLENSYHLFHAGGIDWLILALEFGPRDAVLEWANRIISYYYNRRIIIVTHSYLYFDNTLHGSRRWHMWTPTSYDIKKSMEGVNNGADIWEKCIQLHDNIAFVFCGHIIKGGTGFLISITTGGNKVYQMLANYQMQRRGGDGYLRILHFNPSEKSVIVRTYSPFLKRYKTDQKNEFVIEDADFF